MLVEEGSGALLRDSRHLSSFDCLVLRLCVEGEVERLIGAIDELRKEIGIANE